MEQTHVYQTVKMVASAINRPTQSARIDWGVAALIKQEPTNPVECTSVLTNGTEMPSCGEGRENSLFLVGYCSSHSLLEQLLGQLFCIHLLLLIGLLLSLYYPIVYIYHT